MEESSWFFLLSEQKYSGWEPQLGLEQNQLPEINWTPLWTEFVLAQLVRTHPFSGLLHWPHLPSLWGSWRSFVCECNFIWIQRSCCNDWRSQCKEWKINSWKKRISEYLINNPKFISTLSEAVGNYFVGDLVICLDKMKSEAWRLTVLWKNKHKEAYLFKKLWKLQTLVKKLRTTQILKKDSPAHPFTFLEAELRETVAENWDNPLKGQKIEIKKLFLKWLKFGLSKLWYDGLVGKTAIASIQSCRFKS